MPGAWVSHGGVDVLAKIELTQSRIEATAKAMLDAVGRLVRDGSLCCSFSNLIVGKHKDDASGQTDGEDPDVDVDGNLDKDGLNPNQVRAVESSKNPLTLIWGPPGIQTGTPLHADDLTISSGTGKTTVVVKILRKFFETLGEEEKILMTASTHNGTSLLRQNNVSQTPNRRATLI